MKRMIPFVLWALFASAITDVVWYFNWPAPPPKAVAPPVPVIVGNVRDTISALLPAAFDAAEKYPEIADTDSTVMQQHNSRVNICVYADDTVKITVSTDIGENISGQGPSLRSAENDLGKKTDTISKLLN